MTRRRGRTRAHPDLSAHLYSYRQMREPSRGHPSFAIRRLQGRPRQVRAIPQGRAALENYLINNGLRRRCCEPASGEGRRAGCDLKILVEQARTIAACCRGLHTRYNRQVVSSRLRSGRAQFEKIFGDHPRRRPAEPYIAKRSDALAARPRAERGLAGQQFTEGSVKFERMRQGRDEDVPSSRHCSALPISMARKLAEFAPSLQEVYPASGVLRRKAMTRRSMPVSLFQGGKAAAARGSRCSVQGPPAEMKPRPDLGGSRRHQCALAVEVTVRRAARRRNNILAELMGDLVELAADFLQKHAAGASVDV